MDRLHSNQVAARSIVFKLTYWACAEMTGEQWTDYITTTLLQGPLSLN